MNNFYEEQPINPYQQLAQQPYIPSQIQQPHNTNNGQIFHKFESTAHNKLDFGGDRSKPHPDAFMHDFNEENREDFNPKLFERNDEDTIKQLENVILSCQRDRYFTLKVTSFRVIYNYEDIQSMLWMHEQSRKKPNDKKFENQYDYINLKDSDIILLQVNYFIRVNNNPALKPNERETNLQVLIAIPRYVDKYYFRISGNYYSAMLQIVDGSVYNNSDSKSKKQSITMKTVMPVRIFRISTLLTNYDGEKVKCVYYASHIFTKYLDAMKYILARYGLYGTYQFLDINCIRLSDTPNEDTENYYSFKKFNIILNVPRKLFDNEAIVQSLCVTILNNIMKDTKLEELFNPRYWVCSIGGEFKSFTLEKGIPVLDSLESIYDITTKETLRLPDGQKGDIYFVLRWLMREFSQLRMRDNLDCSFKRIRLPEYIASIYSMKVLKGIYRISDEGRNISVDKISRAIYTHPMYILSAINQTKLISYVDMVNDNDAATALEYTYKGISGIGDAVNGNGYIPIAYRFTHPSQIGRIDLDSSSPSDPGLSGILCPHTDIYDNGYFQDYQEPNDWINRYNELLDEYNELRGMQQVITFQKECGFDFDSVKDEIVKEALETYHKMICPIIDINNKIDYSLNTSIKDTMVNNPFKNLISLEKEN